ncbi:MAG: hypothetical protein RIT37_415, partial [Bacteroidota bacterium]
CPKHRASISFMLVVNRQDCVVRAQICVKKTNFAEISMLLFARSMNISVIITAYIFYA